MNEPIYLTNQEARMEVARWYNNFKKTWWLGSNPLVYLTPYTGGERMGLHATIRVPTLPESTIIYPVLKKDTSVEVGTAIRMGIIEKSATYVFCGSHQEFRALIKRTWYECIGDLEDGPAKIYASDVFARTAAENDRNLQRKPLACAKHFISDGKPRREP